MLVFGMFSFVRLAMECSCMAPLTPAVMVMRGLVFQPLFWMVLIRGSYLASLYVMACSGNLSWQYVNSMSWIVCLGEGDMGGFRRIYRMYFKFIKNNQKVTSCKT